MRDIELADAACADGRGPWIFPSSFRQGSILVARITPSMTAGINPRQCNEYRDGAGQQDKPGTQSFLRALEIPGRGGCERL